MESIEFQSEVARTQSQATSEGESTDRGREAGESCRKPQRRHLLGYQNLSAKQLAAHLKVPRTWVLDNSKERVSDPIPCFALGKRKRFRWGSPELLAWIDRQVVCDFPVDLSQSHEDWEYEYLDSAELAARLNISESWVRDQVRTRATESIPHLRLGKYVRFRWGSPELEIWAEHRMLSSNNGTVSRAERKESVQ